jgi:hypothetical protein
MDSTTFQSLLTAASTIAAAISAIAAWQALRLGHESQKYAREQGRPYFSFEAARMEQKPLPNHPGTATPAGLNPSVAVAKGIFKNYGARPATGVITSVYVLSHDEAIAPLEIPSSLADDFPPGAEWMVQFGEQQIISPNQYGHYFAVGINYNDPLTNKNFRQMFFMKWPGVKSGVVFGDIVAATNDERIHLISKHRALFARYV